MKPLLALSVLLSGLATSSITLAGTPSPSSAIEATQRGARIFEQVCSACHGMNRLQYGDLLVLDDSPAAYKALTTWAASRQATLASPIASPYPNATAAKAENFGDVPPDLSVIARTIKGGPDYIQAMLADYQSPPPDVTLPPGNFYNPIALTHHHHFHMRPPFHDGMNFGPGAPPASVPEMAHDVTAFLVWSANPHAQIRSIIGTGVMIYLLILTLLMGALTHLLWCKSAKKRKTGPTPEA